MTVAQFRTWLNEIYPLTMMEAGEEPPQSRSEIEEDLARARKNIGLKTPKPKVQYA